MTGNLSSARGMIYGLAIGDALGRETEFMSLHHIKSTYGVDGITDLPEPALFTDDTQMTIAIAEALIRAGERDLESIMQAVKEEFMKWYHSPENTRAPGRTCLKAIASMEKGTHWSQSGVRDSKGCGSAMRSAAIGYFYQDDPEKLMQVARASGLCTHGHPAADAACIGAAYLVKLALDGINPELFVSELLAFTEGISKEWGDAITKVERCLGWEDKERALDYLGAGWVDEEVVSLALYCFLKYPNSYEKVVIRAANTDGDSDSIACIGGSISGAYLGVETIPENWIRRVEKSQYLNELATRLAEKRNVYGQCSE